MKLYIKGTVHEMIYLKDCSRNYTIQAELRLNQSDYERSQVEMEQMQEKVTDNLSIDQKTTILLNIKTSILSCYNILY